MIEEFMERLQVHINSLKVAVSSDDNDGFLQILGEMREDIENIEEACDATR